MKRIYVVIIALLSLAAGYELHHIYPGRHAESKEHDLGMSTMTFSPTSAVIHVCKGTKTNDNNYYLNIINYGADSVTVNAVDSFNLKYGATIQYDGGPYEFIASHSGIDSIPMSTLTTTYYTIVDSTIYTRYGVFYGADNTGKGWSFNMSCIVSMQGQPGSVVKVGVAPIDMQE